MKKFLSFLFCCILALGITGCGNDTDKIEDNSNSNNNNTVVSEEKEPLSLETLAGILLIGSIHKDYKINKGKTVKQSYAYPDLQPPMQEETDYDISELTEK